MSPNYAGKSFAGFQLTDDLPNIVFNASPSSGPWQEYNFAPESRTQFAREIFATEGDVQKASSVLGGKHGDMILSGKDALITFDFRVNTCGIVTLDFGRLSDSGQKVSIAFSESKAFVGRGSDRSMDFHVEDGALSVTVDGQGTWTCPDAQQRGAFRYMTLYMETSGTVELCGIKTYNNMMPSMGDDLRQYPGFFFSNDEFLNTIWYAGAYTLQLATIPTNTGRRSEWVHKKIGWSNDVPAALEGTVEVLTDGARRDRTVWSGDRAVSTLTNFIALNNKASAKNGVDWMFEHQTDEGVFPYACPPIWHYGSDSYHLWTYIALYNTYFFDGGDDAKGWVRQKWPALKRGLDYAIQKIDDTGLLKVTMPLDWGRHPLKGHNLQVQGILYFSLQKCAELASDVMGDESLAKKWSTLAASVQKAVTRHLWNETEGMYTDYIGSNILSQDGNALAIWHGLPDSQTKTQRISKGLMRNWNEFGAVAPESPKMISVFCSSMELIAHFEAQQPDRAMKLLRRMWGYIWNAPYAVQSSLIEGYFHDGRCHYPFTLYDPAYISHAHPWASGPTIVLTSYYVGLTLRNPAHTFWSFEPQPGLNKKSRFAIAGITSDATGFFSAGWKIREDGVLEMAIRAPMGTRGAIGIPTFSQEITGLSFDGTLLDHHSLNLGKNHAYLKDVEGGNHSLVVTYKS